MTAPANFQRLNAAGLNRQHIFNIDDLPGALLSQLAPQAHERQLILIGHGGRDLWSALQAAAPDTADPIDAFTCHEIAGWLAETQPTARYRILYPGSAPVNLQKIGELAGWHHPSPLMLSVDTHWGSWQAYRALVLAETNLPPSPRDTSTAACPDCATQACLTACPAHALTTSGLHLQRCMEWRLSDDSPCASTCLAREQCPAGSTHRYEPAQIRHSYSVSLNWLRQAKAESA